MRQCGDCQLCCRLLPVRAIDKLAGQKCQHQKFKTGCVVYLKPAMPPECRLWNCQWLTGNDTADQSRPDRSHFVIDIMPDFITAKDDDGKPVDIPVVQIWIDPKYPDEHRDPDLRAFLNRRGEHGVAALIRYDSRRAITIFPPSMTGADWVEVESSSVRSTHSFREIRDVLGPMQMEIEL